jgi:pilus assembly protein FimV
MENRKENEGSDLFQDIQEKVDSEMFLRSDDEKEESRVDTASPDEKELITQEEDSAFEVMVDMADPDFSETDLDYAFLEEIEYLPPEGEEAASDRVSPSGTSEAMSPVAPKEDQGFEGEPEFVQEDDRFLGELIGREMVKEEEEPLPFALESEEESASDHQKGKEDVLATRTLGDLYAEQGLYDKAASIYERLVQIAPEDEALREKLDDLRKKQAMTRGGEGAIEMSTDTAEPSGAWKVVMIHRLEEWLTRVRAEKEKRCLKGS